jgi:hypothetical protein
MGEFVQVVMTDVAGQLAGRERSASKTATFLRTLNGADASGFRLPASVSWHDLKECLRLAIDDALRCNNGRIVFLWDEFPVMLDNVMRRQSKGVAVELLTTLRGLRQQRPSLRLVLTGSTGLHHIISALKGSGGSDTLVNDVPVIEVPPLSPGDAEHLALQLFNGEAMELGDGRACSVLASEVDNVPYYIHVVVAEAARRGQQIDSSAVRELVRECLVAPHDPWKLRHFVDRIQWYYPTVEVPTVHAILDFVAAAAGPVRHAAIVSGLNSAGFDPDAVQLRELLNRLQMDHYVRMDHSGAFEFTFSLVKRSWRLQRGIEP